MSDQYCIHCHGKTSNLDCPVHGLNKRLQHMKVGAMEWQQKAMDLERKLIAAQSERDEYKALLDKNEGRIKVIVDERLVAENTRLSEQNAALTSNNKQLLDDRFNLMEQVGALTKERDEIFENKCGWQNKATEYFNLAKELAGALKLYAHIPIANDEFISSNAPSNQNYIAREALAKYEAAKIGGGDE